MGEQKKQTKITIEEIKSNWTKTDEIYEKMIIIALNKLKDNK